MTFLKAAIDGRSPLDVWVLAIVVVAALAVLIYFSISALEKFRKPKIADGLEYLRNEDSELGGAIRDMAWRSAWGKWFTSQSLANSLHPDEALTMRAAASLVQDALTNSQLEVRGRRPGQLDYEPIPRTHWRSSGLHMIPDGMSLWKMILIPRGGAEITPDGKVIGRDQDAVQRTDQLATYDSLIVNARQFEPLVSGKPTAELLHQSRVRVFPFVTSEFRTRPCHRSRPMVPKCFNGKRRDKRLPAGSSGSIPAQGHRIASP